MPIFVMSTKRAKGSQFRKYLSRKLFVWRLTSHYRYDTIFSFTILNQELLLCLLHCLVVIVVLMIVYPLVTGVFLTNSVFACGYEIRAKVETYSYIRLTRSRQSDDLSLTQEILITKSCMTWHDSRARQTLTKKCVPSFPLPSLGPNPSPSWSYSWRQIFPSWAVTTFKLKPFCTKNKPWTVYFNLLAYSFDL